MSGRCRRWLPPLAVAGAVALAPAPAAAQIEAWPEARLGGDADRDGIPDGSRAPDAAADDRVTLLLRATGDACRPGLRWRIDGEPVTAEPAGECTYAAPATADAEHVVELEGVDGELRVRATEHLVVSIGDSVASGEGNPDVRTDLSRAVWLNRICHRSLRSGHAQAALALEARDRGSLVTFVPLGCSGATITRGILGPYTGIEPDRDRTPQPPQLDAVNAIAAVRPVDALVVSVGANDVHFGNVVQFCSAVDDCPRRRFDPRRPTAEAEDPAAPTLDDAVTAALDRLVGRYRDLDRRLSRRVARDRVLLVEYFDPTRGPNGYCAPRLGFGKITAAESEWAQERVMGRLNAVMADAAAEHGWTLVEGVDEAFDGHGICAPPDERWIRTPAESFFRQDALPAFTSIAGTLHPNGRGHAATGRLIRPVLAARLGAVDEGGDDPPGPDDETVLFGMRLVTAVVAGGLLAAAIIAVFVLFLRRRGRPAA